VAAVTKLAWHEGEYASLLTYDREEWWDVCRVANPAITREQFDLMWEEFQKRKQEGTLAQAN
jgi:hypothetical protein